MSVEGDDFVENAERAVEMSVTNHQHTRGNVLLLTKLLKCPSISIRSSKKERFPSNVGSRNEFLSRTTL